MESGEFKPVISFLIDDGELNEVTKEKAFVLGYEFAQVMAWMQSLTHPEYYEAPIHADNVHRIREAGLRLGWLCKFRFSGDEQENWVYLEAGK